MTNDQTNLLVRIYANVADTPPPFRHISWTLETGIHLEQLKNHKAFQLRKEKTIRIFCGQTAVFMECIPRIPSQPAAAQSESQLKRERYTTALPQIRHHGSYVMREVALLHHRSCSIPCRIFIPDHDVHFVSLCGKHI